MNDAFLDQCKKTIAYLPEPVDSLSLGMFFPRSYLFDYISIT